MIITEIQIVKNRKQSNVLATGRVVISSAISFSGINIVNKSGQLGVEFPKNKSAGNSNDGYELIHPINNRVRNVFERLFVNAYFILDKCDREQINLALNKSVPKNFFELSINDFNIYIDKQPLNKLATYRNISGDFKNRNTLSSDDAVTVQAAIEKYIKQHKRSMLSDVNMMLRDIGIDYRDYGFDKLEKFINFFFDEIFTVYRIKMGGEPQKFIKLYDDNDTKNIKSKSSVKSNSENPKVKAKPSKKSENGDISMDEAEKKTNDEDERETAQATAENCDMSDGQVLSDNSQTDLENNNDSQLEENSSDKSDGFSADVPQGGSGAEGNAEPSSAENSNNEEIEEKTTDDTISDDQQ